MSFARPLLLILALFPLWLLLRGRRGQAITVGDGALSAAAAGRAWLPWVPPVLRALALLAWIVAAAGPRLPGGPTTIRRDGIGIVIAIDVSSSMLAEDFAPSNRLEVAKRQAINFIHGREADRIGLVAFAGDALTQIPITLDYAVLEAAVNRLRRVPAKSKVILLLTDGVNNRGAIDPRTAADAAQAFGIKVYTVGVGTQGEARIPTGRGLSGFRYEMLPVEIDEPLLRDIAAKTGGRYFRATDSESLTRIFQQINQLERTRVEARQYRAADETPGPFLLAGLGVFALALGLGASLVVRAP
jgi:Ca-activated chloride channel family protein